MQVIIRNTSRYPDESVFSLVEWATAGIEMHDVCVNVKGSSKLYAGSAYAGVPSISNAPKEANFLVVLRLGAVGDMTHWRQGYGQKLRSGEGEGVVDERSRWPFALMNGWQETLIYVAAHEARHIYQFRTKSPCSELECERFAADRLGRYQQLSLSMISYV